MGRRALPKTLRRVSVASHLVPVDAEAGPSEAGPLDPQDFFPQSQPLEIEIGSGKGLFLRNAAKALPEHNFLGIEVVGKYATFVARRLAQDQCPNARVLHTDGVAFLERIPPQSVAAVHVYFPDPWWKKRHRKRRVMNRRLLQSLERVLGYQGRLHFWTDVREYFDATLMLIDRESSLVGPLAVPESPALHDMDYRTHFERRVRQNGLPVYRAEYCQPMWRVEYSAQPPTGGHSYVVGPGMVETEQDHG